MHRLTQVVAISALLMLALSAAGAHAILDHAEPRAGKTVSTAPHEVKLWFTEELEPAFSSITVTNTVGRRVDSGKVRVSGELMSISLGSTTAGTYHVIWRAVSMDTHTTDGSFTFQVGH